MTDDPEDVISESETIQYWLRGGWGDLKFPLSQYTDEELLELATELGDRRPRPGDSHDLSRIMAHISLEMNRRIFQRQVVDSSE